eukprot:jgi/Mesen1/7373/ME000382S06575
MSYNKRSGRSALFDDLEAGGLKASSSYTGEIAEQENDQSLSELEDRARLIKQLTKDIHGEVESQNKFLDSMGIEFESARRVLSGTVDKFTKVFETKSSRNLATIVVSCVALFALVYFITKR